MSQQTFHQWKQASIQGAIPQSDAGWQKEFIHDALAIALPNLQAAADTAKHLKATHNDLYTAICDALNACSEALERITDAPDDTPAFEPELIAFNGITGDYLLTDGSTSDR